MSLAPKRQVLFNPGPVNLDPQITTSLFNVELSHRQPEFEALEASVRDRLYTLFGISRDDVALSLLHGSGSLAVDAALATFVRGRVLVVNNGLYCERLTRTLTHLGAHVETVDFGIGGRVDVDRVDAALARLQPAWVATVHHETTTGILNPLEDVARRARAHGARVYADVVSSFGVHTLPGTVDLASFNSGKCLESVLGVAGVWWRRDLEAFDTVPVLDVTTYAEGLPSTPNVPAMIALDVALDLYAAEDRPARYRRLAGVVWRQGSSHFQPLLPEADRSWVLTSFLLEGRDPDKLFARALDRGFVIYHGQRHLRDQIFRVANMGAAMNDEVIAELFEVLAS